MDNKFQPLLFDDSLNDRGQRHLQDALQKKIYINSRNRDAGTATRFRINLDTTYNNIKSLELHICSIPNTIYLIRTGVNDTFNLAEFGVGNATVTLSAGSYSSTQIETELMTQLDAVSLASLSGATYTVSISPTTLKMTIVSTGPQFDLTFSGTQYELEQYIGFLSGVNSSSLVGGSQTLVSTNVVNLSPLTELFLKFTNFGNIIRTDEGVSSAFMVPVLVNYGDYIIFQENNGFPSIIFQSYNEINLSYLEVELVDRFGQPVDLNGAEWSFCISFKLYGTSF